MGKAGFQKIDLHRDIDLQISFHPLYIPASQEVNSSAVFEFLNNFAFKKRTHLKCCINASYLGIVYRII